MRLPGSRVPPAQSWQASDRRRSVIHIVLFSERIKTVPSWFGWLPTMVCCTRSIPTQVLRFLPMCQAHWPIGWGGLFFGVGGGGWGRGGGGVWGGGGHGHAHETGREQFRDRPRKASPRRHGLGLCRRPSLFCRCQAEGRF